MTDASPRPWTIMDHQGWIADSEDAPGGTVSVAIGAKDDAPCCLAVAMYPDHDLTLANAALIVRAVNQEALMGRVREFCSRQHAAICTSSDPVKIARANAFAEVVDMIDGRAR